MEKSKIKMPTGAIVACIIVVLFMVAAVFGIGLLLYNNLSENEASVSDPTETPLVTSQPTAVVQSTPDMFAYTDNQASTNAVTDVIARCKAAVVSIDVAVEHNQDTVDYGSGSGVIVTSDGYIVTCNHVVEGGDVISVYLDDGTMYEATLIGADSVTDIAVVKIDAKDLPFAEIGSSSSLVVGTEVYAIGNALGVLANTVTDGIVSGLDREISVEGQGMTLLQTSAAVNSGNSGGGLFTADGALIGIVNAKSSGSSIEGLGFAVPIDIAMPVVNDLVTYGFVKGRPFLGVSTQDVSYGVGFFFTDTYPQVVEVFEGGSADVAGILPNDIITAIDGIAVSSGSELRTLICTYDVGDTVTVTIMRGTETLYITVTLLERTE